MLISYFYIGEFLNQVHYFICIARTQFKANQPYCKPYCLTTVANNSSSGAQTDDFRPCSGYAKLVQATPKRRHLVEHAGSRSRSPPARDTRWKLQAIRGACRESQSARALGVLCASWPLALRSPTLSLGPRKFRFCPAVDPRACKCRGLPERLRVHSGRSGPRLGGFSGAWVVTCCRGCPLPPRASVASGEPSGQRTWFQYPGCLWGRLKKTFNTVPRPEPAEGPPCQASTPKPLAQELKPRVLTGIGAQPSGSQLLLFARLLMSLRCRKDSLFLSSVLAELTHCPCAQVQDLKVALR